MPQHIWICSAKQDVFSCNKKTRIVGCLNFAKNLKEHLKFPRGGNVGIWSPPKMFFETAVLEHKNLRDIILNRSTTHLPSYNHFLRDV